MNIYTCPVCRNHSVLWDRRAEAFLCHATSCRTWFPPPEVDAKDVSEGMVVATQLWMNAHAQKVKDRPVLQR